MAPFLVIGVGLNIWRPEVFSVGGPSPALRVLSIAVLAIGVVAWLWSVVLILTRVPRRELITAGPFALVKHPLYTAVSLLVLPWAGFLLDTWLGLLLGLIIYSGSRVYAREEELVLAAEFGESWDAYDQSVRLPWV